MKKNILSIVFVLFFFNLAEARNEKIKGVSIAQLQVKLSQAKTPADKAQRLLDIANYYYDEDKDSTLRYANLSLTTARKSGNSKGEILALKTIAEKYCITEQTEEADSLFQLAIKLAKSNKFESLEGLLYMTYGRSAVYAHKPEIGDKYLNLALQKNKNDSAFQLETYTNLALSSMMSSQIKTAFSYFNKGKMYLDSTKASEENANYYNNLAIIYQELGNDALSLENFLKVLRIKEKLGYPEGLAKILFNVASVFTRQNKYAEAEEYLARGKIVAEKNNYTMDLANYYYYIGVLYQQKGEYQKAIEPLEKSGELYLKAKSKVNWTYSQNMLSWSYAEVGELDKAERIAKAALDYRIANDNPANILTSIGYLSYVYLLKKDYPATIKLIEDGLKKYHNEAEALVADLYFTLYQAYKESGNYKKALEVYEKLNESKDKIYSDKTADAVANMKEIYETEKKELQILNLEGDKKLKEKELSEAKIRNYFMLAGIAFLLVVSFLILRGFIQKRKSNELLQKQKDEIEVQNEQLNLANIKIEQKNKEVLDSINYAKRIQSAILPSDRMLKECLREHFVLYLPKDIVSGDFYWLEKVENAVLFAVVDCTGHGVPGAMVSVVGHNCLNRAVREFNLREPAAILDKLNELVEETFSQSDNEVSDGMDISLCKLNLSTGELEWAGANNPLYIIREKNGEKILEEIKADKQPIGRYISRKPFTNHRLTLNKKDSIFVFSDGYADQFGGEERKKYKTVRLKEFLLQHCDKSPEIQREMLKQEHETWKGNYVQMDDICMISVEMV